MFMTKKWPNTKHVLKKSIVLFSISLRLTLFTARVNQEQSSRKESEKQAALALFHFHVICFSFPFTSNSPSVILPWAQWQTPWLHHQHETWVLNTGQKVLDWMCVWERCPCFLSFPQVMFRGGIVHPWLGFHGHKDLANQSAGPPCAPYKEKARRQHIC